MPMRITHSKNAAGSKRYFELSDYLDQDPNHLLKGYWFGTGAKFLGLSGEVRKELFDRLIDNQMPFDDEKLTQRVRADRRVGTDLTFSAPKSVSLLWAVTEDNEILEAVQKSAHQTLADLEQDAQTRINHRRGHMSLAKTRNIVGASWLHTTSRPVDGYPDPNLHVHSFVINATKAKDRWTAVDLSAVVRDSGYYEAVFQSRLAENLQAIGYPVERNTRDFEIAGVKRATVEKYSRRTALIEQEAEERGITSPLVKGQLGAKTRDKKSESQVAMEDLPKKWRSLLDSKESKLFRQLTQKTDTPSAKNDASKAVDFAIGHEFERESVIRERKLLRTAILHGIGEASVDDVQKAVAVRPLIREGIEDTALVTTREVLTEERALLSFVKAGKGQYPALAPNHQISRDWLSEEQKKAASGVLNSHDRVMIVRGVAGSGKTTLMRETIEAAEKSGNRVTVLAPTAEAAHDVLAKQEGFEAETLARFLVDESLQSKASGGVIWVDEGALVGTRDLSRLARIADAIDARIILSGDAKQHQPVAAGLPFQLLEQKAGVKPFEVKTIRRQEQEDYRSAVATLSSGQAESGLKKLDSLGFVTEIDDDQARYRQLAADYADSIQAKKSTLVIAPTHAERDAVVDAIRSELKSRAMIDKSERTVQTLQSKRLTAAQRTDSTNYTPGDVVEFVTRGKGGYKPGDRLTVSSIDGNRVLADGPGGKIAVPVDSPKSFDVYRPVERHIAKGDTLRITKNRRPDRHSGEKRLSNGSLVTLSGFAKNGDLKLSNGQTIPAQWGHVDYGNVLTSYGSQGKTFDRVLVAQGSLSYPASDPSQLYVSASRAREKMMIYTDRKADLYAAVSKHRIALNASDLAAQQPKGGARVQQSRLRKQVERLRLSAKRIATMQWQRIQQSLYLQHPKPTTAR
ncbi:MAG: MobF family relaxase [Planctomycetota bacterium]